MKEIFIKTEFIRLGQFVKYINLISSGGDIKSFLLKNKVIVNNQVEDRRGRKLYNGDQVELLGLTYIIRTI